MTPNYLFGFTMLLACCFIEITSRPSNNESPTLSDEISDKEPIKPKAIADREDGSIYYQADTDINITEESTKEIVDKIKEINSGLNKPRRQQINYNSPYSEKSNGIDEETLEKIKQIIASVKLNPYSNPNSQLNSYDQLSVDEQNPYSRALRVTPNTVYSDTIPMMPYYYPYPMNYPVILAPITNEILNKYAAFSNIKSISPSSLKSSLLNEAYQTRQEQQPLFPGFPSFPSFSFDNLFPFRPFSQIFPLLIKNPFVAFTQGGGLENFIEYGQNADVCSRKQKSTDDEYIAIIKKIFEQNDDVEQSDTSSNDNNISELNRNSRESRGLLKRTIKSGSSEQEVASKNPRKIYAKPSSTRKTTKKPLNTEKAEDSQSDTEGSLRFPFGGDFTWFGNKKPVAPSPGFFINRLRVRKGGVAIAGPGGVATAGNGGTAIVGPGGLAYTKPGGLAIAGPHARVVALSPEHDFNTFVSRAAELDDKSRSSIPIREGKLVATGPVIYYHPTEPPTKETAAVQYIPFYGGAKGQYLEVKKDAKGAVLSEKVVAEDSISSENIMKNNDENLLSKVLAVNLQTLKSLSSNLLKIHNLGRKTGTLGHQERIRFKNQLFSLGEAASNTIKLIDEIGEDVDVLFKRNATLVRQYGEEDQEDVGEEGIGIDSSDSGESYDGSIIAEARPVGLAVIGESGLAASRPMATAVASSGVAIARPIGTAIAGIDPSNLGINYHLNQEKSYKINGQLF